MPKGLPAGTITCMLAVCFAQPAEKARLREAERDGDLQRIESFRDNAKSSRLAALSDEMQERWKDQDADLYGSVMVSVLSLLNNEVSRELGDVLIVDDRLIRVLERKREMSLVLHEPLIHLLSSGRLRKAHQRLGEDAFATRRQLHTVRMLETVAIAERERDEAWDPSDVPAVNLVPPAATGLPSGVSPEAVKDPALRAIYERDIEANRKKAERHSHQHRIRQMEEHLYDQIRKRLMALYSVDDVDELRRLCDETGVPAAWRDQLLEQIMQ